MGPKGVKLGVVARPVAALALAGLLAGCGGASDMFSRDADWFAGRSSLFSTRSLTIENQALTSTRPVSPEDLVSADGTCLGMQAPAAPVDSNAQAGPADLRPGTPPAPQAAPPPGDPAFAGAAPSVGVALGMTECDVARSEGIAANVVIGANERGERDVTLTYIGGARPGIYRFTAGRLTSIERAPEPPKPERPQRSRNKPRRG